MSPGLPLVHCRECASPLLQPLDVAGPIDGLSIVARFCPDCEHRDLVVAEHIVVELWLLRNKRLATWMAALADAPAAEVELTTTALQR
jgi:hypothetical protein